MATYQNQYLIFSQMSDEEVQKTLTQYNIALSVQEARDVEEKILKRPPTLTEALAFSIQGSEHCSYRSSKPYLKSLPTDAPNVIQGPQEDAGIVEIATVGEERYGVVFAHESHNHPSQIVPYEGAATGIGGIVRDVVCMGAKVIGTADPLRFGEIENNKSRWIAEGVVNGISGYGNPIGVPNLGGDLYFDKSYNDNCLVNVVALGMIKESDIIHSCAPQNSVGYNMILVGKPTDNSGFGGASFASVELDDKEKEKNKGAVQEPNAFLKRHLFESTYDLFKILREKGLKNRVGFKDLGAGGVICASVEMAETAGYGAEVNLDKVHISIDDLAPYVTLCAETQERFLWVADDQTTELILDHYNNKWDLPKVSVGARASVIGKVTEGNYVVTYQGSKILDIEPKTLCQGLQYEREVKPQTEVKNEPELAVPEDLNEVVKNILAHENIACRVPIFEQYDKQVQGNTIIESGQADAGVIAPLLDEDVPQETKKIGVALSVDANPRYGSIDPYWQGVNAVAESMRNVAAVGAHPIAMTDCLNYGNPEKPEQMWEFSQGVKGVGDAARNIHLKTHRDFPTPIISGNVSLYNQSKKGGSITPTAIIACLGKIKDYTKAITMRFKKENSAIYLMGKRKDELGGSVYYDLFSELGANVPKPDFATVEQEIYAVTDAIEQGVVSSCHDISDGGLVTTLSEMCFDIPTVGQEYPKVGVEVDLNNVNHKDDTQNSSPDSANSENEGMQHISNVLNLLNDEKNESENWNGEIKHISLKDKKQENIIKLFSETGGFVLEVEQEKVGQFESLIKNYSKIDLFKVGKTNVEPQFVIKTGDDKIVDLKVEEIETIWLEGLRDKL